MAAMTKYNLRPRRTTQTILKKCWKDLGLEVDEKDLEYIAQLCKDFEGRDLRLLCIEAGRQGWGGLPKSIKHQQLSRSGSGPSKYVIKVNREHVIKAKEIALGRMTRGLDLLVTDVTWDDIGGLERAKEEMKRYVLTATRNEGLCPTRGILLYGPQGCGKTSLVMAAARAAEASLFCLVGSILFSLGMEGGEEMIRRTFRVARLFPPSIIFLHDMDRIFIKSGDCSYGTGEYTAKDLSRAQQVLNVFLEEMEGLHGAHGVIVVSIIDAYHQVLMKQAGGPFDEALSVPLPNLQERKEILSIKTKPLKLAADVNLEYIAQNTEKFTGALLQSLIRKASSFVNPEATCISMHHFQQALDNVGGLPWFFE